MQVKPLESLDCSASLQSSLNPLEYRTLIYDSLGNLRILRDFETVKFDDTSDDINSPVTPTIQFRTLRGY